MSKDVMKMEPLEVITVASAFVPLGKEDQAGKEVSAGVLRVDASNITPKNITPFQAWARNVCIEHAATLLDFEMTKRGVNYLGFMSDMAKRGLRSPPKGGTLAMLKKVHKSCTPNADILWEAEGGLDND